MVIFGTADVTGVKDAAARVAGAAGLAAGGSGRGADVFFLVLELFSGMTVLLCGGPIIQRVAAVAMGCGSRAAKAIVTRP